MVHKPAPVPLHFCLAVKAGLDLDVKRGIIKKVQLGSLLHTWCAKMVITPKKDGRPQRMIDLSALTRAGIRENQQHHTWALFNVVCLVPRNILKTTLDCVDGYHGVPLAEADCHKTTFVTKYSRYQYLRAPQGYMGPPTMGTL